MAALAVSIPAPRYSADWQDAGFGSLFLIVHKIKTLNASNIIQTPWNWFIALLHIRPRGNGALSGVR